MHCPWSFPTRRSSDLGVYYFVANSSGDVLFEPEGGPDLARFAATEPPIELADRRKMTVWTEGGAHYRGAVVLASADFNLSDQYTIAVAMDIGGHLSFMRSFERIQWWTIRSEEHTSEL